MKKFSSSAKSFWNYRSLSLPKGRNAVTGSTLTCHPEWYTEPAEVQAKRVEGSLAAFLIAFLLTACGESTTTEKIVEVATGNTEIVSSVKDLPKCTKDNAGEQVWVKDESATRICVDGKWFATKESSKDTIYVNDGEFSCTTRELKDKSGLKIICNGDSIGVVLNGVNGKDGSEGKPGTQGEKGDSGENGKDGVGCSIAAQTDSLVTIKCGDKSMTLNLRADGVTVDTTSADTVELDSEKIAISLDSLSGYSQKGPFLKGSTVLLYELSDGRTLKQMGSSFTSKIASDDGRYKFSSRNLVSQYALIEVDGKYRNEVTGEPTKTAIKLQAYTNMLMRKSANVNLLTHLEKERVFYRVTKEKKTVRAAKKQAQAEIFKAFHIDASQFNAESEDLDVFGKTDADAALLAISILLQRDSSETELSVLLTDMADDLAEDGSWDNAAKKVEIADWAATMDLSFLTSARKLATIRDNVKSWNLGGGNVPDFEKFVRKFWSEELGLGVCGSDSTPMGTLKVVPNKNSNLPNRLSHYKCTADGWKFDVEGSSGTMKDAAGKVYRTITLANHVWMAENLNYEVENSYCFENSVDSCAKYGRLYTWAAAVGKSEEECGIGKSCGLTELVRGVCPEGWHLPSISEWNTLYSAMENSPYTMVAKGYWRDATDAYGFSALPIVESLNGTCSIFWSSTEEDDFGAATWSLCPSFEESNIANVNNGKNGKDFVRCVQD